MKCGHRWACMRLTVDSVNNKIRYIIILPIAALSRIGCIIYSAKQFVRKILNRLMVYARLYGETIVIMWRRRKKEKNGVGLWPFSRNSRQRNSILIVIVFTNVYSQKKSTIESTVHTHTHSYIEWGKDTFCLSLFCLCTAKIDLSWIFYFWHGRHTAIGQVVLLKRYHD